MKKRVISAIIMIVICVPFLVFGGFFFKVGVGLLSCLAYKEILTFNKSKKYPFPVAILGLIIFLIVLYSSGGALFNVIGIDYKCIAVLYLAMFLPCIFYYSNASYKVRDAMELTSFILLISFTLNTLMNLFLYEKAYFILIILVAIITDTFAFFTGITIGEHKCTKISPKKSVEGYIGGILMGTIIPYIYYINFIGAAKPVVAIVSLISMAIMCELGDLFFSAIKRENDIKDFSNLIPEHGGILDRIDSITFVTLMLIILKSII